MLSPVSGDKVLGNIYFLQKRLLKHQAKYPFVDYQKHLESPFNQNEPFMIASPDTEDNKFSGILSPVSGDENLKNLEERNIHLKKSHF